MCDIAGNAWDIISTRSCEHEVCNTITFQSFSVAFNSTIITMYYPLALILMLSRKYQHSVSPKWSYNLRCINNATSQIEEIQFEYNEKNIECDLLKYKEITDVLLEYHNQNKSIVSKLKSPPSFEECYTLYNEQPIAFTLLQLVWTILFSVLVVYGFIKFSRMTGELIKTAPITQEYYRRKLGIIKNGR